MALRSMVLAVALSILVILTGCNTDNDRPDTNPNPNGNDLSGTTGTPQGGNGMNDGANEGYEAQDFRPLYRRGDTDSDWRGGRFFSLNRERDLDSRRLKEESRAFSSAFGFREYTANDSQASYRGFGSQTYTIDRQLLADLIGQVVVGLPDVERASVLVTDRYCLIGYEADGTNQNLDEQIAQSADSVAPGWYKVYATHDPRLANHIRQIAQQYDDTTDVTNLTQEVNALIERLGGPDRTQEDQIKAPHKGHREAQNRWSNQRKMDNYHRQGNINQQ